MDTNQTVVNPPASRKRRRHSDKFKAQVIATCLQPGVSIAAVALANQLNTNLLRTWVKAFRKQQQRDVPAKVEMAGSQAAAKPPTSTLVPVKVQDGAMPAGDDIRIEIRQSQRVVHVSWPVSQAEHCAEWLREVLR
jgi:transposase-like protein